MKRLRILTFLILGFYSCDIGIGKRKTLHDEYSEMLLKSGLENTMMGQEWFRAAEMATTQPRAVTLPYRETGFFPAEKPMASGLRFSIKTGQKLIFELTTNPQADFFVFADLWKLGEDDSRRSALILDSAQRKFEYESEKNETLILRLQPRLLESGNYTISISTAPSLGFPVAGGAARIGSFWGDARGDGSRRHEGVDIFAPKRTPVIAAAEGKISSVTTNRLGGKVVFLRPNGKGYALYYAHLDEQLVSRGQKVMKGDTIGLVGNTGNARTTPPHLHFGIYGPGGAIDPYPFVNPEIQKPVSPLKQNGLGEMSRLNQRFRIPTGPKTRAGVIEENSLIIPYIAWKDSVRAMLPDKTFIHLSVKQIENISVISREKLAKSTSLLDRPFNSGALKKQITKEVPVEILAGFGEYKLVRQGVDMGWVPANSF